MDKIFLRYGPDVGALRAWATFGLPPTPWIAEPQGHVLLGYARIALDADDNCEQAIQLDQITATQHDS